MTIGPVNLDNVSFTLLFALACHSFVSLLNTSYSDVHKTEWSFPECSTIRRIPARNSPTPTKWSFWLLETCTISPVVPLQPLLNGRVAWNWELQRRKCPTLPSSANDTTEKPFCFCVKVLPNCQGAALLVGPLKEILNEKWLQIMRWLVTYHNRSD